MTSDLRPLSLAAALALLLAIGGAASARASQPVEEAAPYEYLGWGSPQPPLEVISATGIRDLTLAFILSHGSCNPEWDGQRPLSGGADQAAIEAIRAAGGDVAVSFGGWSGKKLGSSCKTVASLAGAYQKVIDAYSLRAIDIDIEHGEIKSPKTRARVIAALAAVQGANPGLEISVTFGTAQPGPEAAGLSLVADAAAIGFQPTAWTIMPFDFGPTGDMGQASITAAEGLEQDLLAAYPLLSEQAAYEHVGISSMNGRTDEAGETVGVADLQTMLAFAQLHHLARLTFWSVNRDRACTGKMGADECSGISQAPYAFTDVIGQYHG
jgi:chitinase